MAAIADDEAGVRMALEVCGATDEQQDAIVAEKDSRTCRI
jgi:hypothetical protein